MSDYNEYASDIPVFGSLMNDQTKISSDAAREALARITSSNAFRGAPQLVSFLTYIVEATLAGKQAEIKGYTIAVEALGRPQDFDPVSDPIVRVEAGRLRKTMELYYAGEGAADPVRIVVERGGYVPFFVAHQPAVTAVPPPTAETPVTITAATDPAQSSAPAPAADAAVHVAAASALSATPAARKRLGPLAMALAAMLIVGAGALAWRMAQPTTAPITAAELDADESGRTSAPAMLPVIRITALPSNDPAIDKVSRDFSEQMIAALTRFDEFVVVDTQAVSVSGGRPIRPTYVIEHRGQLGSDHTVIATMRLLEGATGRVVWSSGADLNIVLAQDPREARELVRRVVVRLAQPYGVLHADMHSHSRPGEATRCVVDAYDYWIAPSQARHGEVRTCLEALIKSNPAFHPAWSLLSMLTLDEHRIGYNVRPEPLERALMAARRAIQLAPESARAQQALMAVLTVSGDVEEGIKTGFNAIRRNPYDTDILADVGARLTQAGRGREGRPLLERAAELNQARPPWHDFYRFLAARQSGDKAGARSMALFLQGSEAPLALLGR